MRIQVLRIQKKMDYSHKEHKRQMYGLFATKLQI